jgi:hypothetical protein
MRELGYRRPMRTNRQLAQNRTQQAIASAQASAVASAQLQRRVGTNSFEVVIPTGMVSQAGCRIHPYDTAI